MPSLAKRPCPVCGALGTGGRCAAHAKQQDRERGTTKQRGYADGWPEVRAEKLALDPVCQIRLTCFGMVATEVDHIIPISERPDLRLEPSNLQSACKPCNVAKARQNREKSRDFSKDSSGLQTCAARLVPAA